MQGKSLSLLCGSLTWLEKRDEARWSYLSSIVNSINLEEEGKKVRIGFSPEVFIFSQLIILSLFPVSTFF